MRPWPNAENALFWLTFSLQDESYLISSFHLGSQGTPKTCSQIRCAEPDALRRRLSVASLSLQDRIQERRRKQASFPSAQQSLQHRRDAVGVPLSDDPRPRTTRDDTVVETEWRLPVFDGTAELSGGNKLAPVSAARRAADVAALAYVARRIPQTHDRSTASACSTAVRCGLDRIGSLRSTGERPSRLQPDQARSTVLSPPAVLRGPEQGLLARGAAARRRLHLRWGQDSAASLLCQAHRSSTECDCAGRQGVLRSCTRRVARARARRLCDRRAADSADQTQVRGAALSHHQPGRGGGRVLLSTASLAAPLSLRRDPPTATRRTDRATDSVQTRTLPRPGLRDEPRAAAAEPLAFLQRSGWHRAHHPTTQRRLRAWRHPHAPLLRQRDVLSSSLARLQSRQLVQATVPATGDAESYPSDPARAHPPDARSIGTHGQPAAPVAAHQWPARACLAIRLAQDPGSQGLKRPFFTPDSGSIEKLHSQLSRSARGSRRQRPELLHQGKQIRDAPMFGDLAV